MSDSQQPIELGYETSADLEPAGPRPWWVWAIVSFYVLLAAGLILLPVMVALSDANETELIWMATITTATFTLAGLGLLFVPLRIVRRRPIARRSVWIPIVSAGFLIGALVAFGGFAILEFTKNQSADQIWYVGIWLGGGAVWVAWSLFWWGLTRSHDPTALSAKLYRWVLGGSIAELLVAVPTHLVVRRRQYCCAGMYTGAAIAVGVVVMIVALGPGVVFLFYRRWKQIHAPIPSPGNPGEG